MPDFKLTGSIGTKRALALILCASLMLLSLPGIAQGVTNSSIKKAQSQAQALQNLIGQLDEEMSAVAEEYDTAQQHLEDTQAAVKKTQTQLTTSQADLTTVQARLTRGWWRSTKAAT